MTDAGGTEVRRLAYAAFGEEAQNVGTGEEPKYTYTAKEADHSGLMYYGARYYDPVLARFITADTMYDRGPQGLNRYSYTLNNPIKYTDPSGHLVILSPWALDAGKKVRETAGDIANEFGEFIDEHKEEIGKGLEQVGMGMEMAGGARIGAAGGLATASIVCEGVSGGVCTPVAAAGGAASTKMAAEGVLMMAAGEFIRQAGKKMQEEAKNEQEKPQRKTTNVPQKGKKFNQLDQRGWTQDSIDDLVNDPYTTRESTNKATGNSATAYFREDGHYIVRDDVTGDLVQMSDTRFTVGTGDGQWKPDLTIKEPYIP